MADPAAPPVPVPPAPKRFTTLEAGRGLAAVMVAVHHATLMVAQPRHLGALAFGGAPVFFNAGVDFFFVLSGFIIAFVHWGDIGKPSAFRPYLRARLTRILPLYWAVLAPLAVIYALHPGFGEPRQHDPLQVATSFLLLPTPEQPVLGVAWTLTFEMGFYLLFAGAIALGRPALWLAIAWAAAIVGFGIQGPPAVYPLSFVMSPHNLQFLMGVAAAAWLRARRVPAPRTVLALGLGLFAATFLLAEPAGLSDPLAQAVALGLGAALCVAGAAELERLGVLRAPGWLVTLGGASYAVYLIHVVAESAAIRLFIGVRMLQPELLVAALTTAGLAAGVAGHLAVERPLMRILRRRTAAPRPATAPAAGPMTAALIAPRTVPLATPLAASA